MSYRRRPHSRSLSPARSPAHGGKRHPPRRRSYSHTISPNRSPPHRRETPMRRDPPSRCSLLVRNLSKDCREHDLRHHAEKYGAVRDVYLPRDYYTREPRGIAFVEYTNARDAEDAKHALDRKEIMGREVSVVFAMQGRKRPDDYRRGRGYGGGGGGGRDRGRRRSMSRSPDRRRRSRSYSPRRRSHSRSPVRRRRSPSRSPPRRRSYTRSRSPRRSPSGSPIGRRASYSRSKSPKRSRSPVRQKRSPSPVNDAPVKEERSPSVKRENGANSPRGDSIRRSDSPHS